MAHEPHGVMVLCPATKDGLASVGLQLLGQGARLAAQLGQPLYAAMAGAQVAPLAGQPGRYGAQKTFLVDHAALETYTAQSHVDALELLVRAAEPGVLLVGATEAGRDVAARLAARLQTGLTADCTALDIDADTGLLEQRRPAYGGNVMATVLCAEKRPQMATVRPGVFAVPAACGETPCPVEDLSRRFAPVAHGVVVQARDEGQQGQSPLAGAKVVVACGRGADEKARGLAQQLADLLGGEVAASRGAVELGFFPRVRQVGQTGQTIRPDCYIACGISGAVQHLVGMQQAKHVIAINSDPAAPIAQAADEVICGDVAEVLAQLVDLVRQQRAGRGLA
ncbi:MAG: electron transfer flavoprotein subunit alpha/FixB family protein [Oscillospiraceae bacterium]